MIEQGKGKAKLIWIQTILWILGILSIGYYVVILSMLGFRKDFSLIWIAGGLVCIGCAVLLHRLKEQHLQGTKRLANVLCVAFIVGVAAFSIMEGIIIKTGYTKASSNADYLIVLGANINGTKVSKALRYRLDAAYDYAVENEDTKVIVSGGQGYGEDVSEAQAMYSYLVERGLEKERIIMEAHSSNTDENIKYSKELIDDKADYVVIVTNRFHLYRGMCIARKQLEQKVGGLGADTGTVLFLNYYVREVFAVMKDYLVHNI